MCHHNHKKLCAIVLAVLFIIPSLSLIAEDNSTKASVTMISNNGFTKTEEFVFQKFREILKDRNLYSETDFQIEYLVDAETVDEKDLIIISVTILQPLSTEIVELNEKEQSFYLTSDKEKLPDTPNGKRVREYISENYIRQARVPVRNFIEILDKSDLKGFITKLVNKL